MAKTSSSQSTNSAKESLQSPKKRTTLEKCLLILVGLLVIALIFLSYLIVSERQNEPRIDPKEHKNAADDSSTPTCHDSNCVLNAADLLRNMDPLADPCQDFYSYACGAYDRSTPIPSHLTSIHVLRQQQQRNRESLRTMIENPKLRAHYAQNAAVTKSFQMYDTCMETNNLDRTGMRSFKDLMTNIGGSNIISDRWSSKEYDVYDAVVQAKRRLNVDLFFKIGVSINPQNSSRNALYIYNTELGLRSKSYLPNLTPQDDKLRYSYKNYMMNMMKSIKGSKSNVRIRMEEVYKLEKRIAKIYARFPTDKSSPTIHKLSRKTKFDWLNFLRKLTANMSYVPRSNDVVLVQSQDILKQTMNTIKTTEKHVLSNYIAWKVLQESISALPTNYSRMVHKYRTSIQSRVTEQPKRWHTCLDILSEAMKMVLSYVYVDQAFSEQSREWVYEIFQEIRKEFINGLNGKTWMDSVTKRKTKQKAESINFLAGYNNDLKDEQKLDEMFREFEVNRTNFFRTFVNQRSFMFKNDIKKLLKPVRKNSFEEVTWNVNAYYSSQENKISFLAGILQRPFYDNRNSRASNYGSLGMFVAHELMHAFDNKGHKYDENGNLRNSWTKFARENFHTRTKCFVEQYNNFSIFGEKVRGLRTLGENIADNGGLKLAFRAFKRSERENGDERPLPGLNLSNDQVFFLSFAQNWCSKYTEDGIRKTIEHRVPMMFRVTGPLRNLKEFSQAYHCPLGSPMNPKTKCDIW